MKLLLFCGELFVIILHRAISVRSVSFRFDSIWFVFSFFSPALLLSHYNIAVMRTRSWSIRKAAQQNKPCIRIPMIAIALFSMQLPSNELYVFVQLWCWTHQITTFFNAHVYMLDCIYLFIYGQFKFCYRYMYFFLLAGNINTPFDTKWWKKNSHALRGAKPSGTVFRKNE